MKQDYNMKHCRATCNKAKQGLYKRILEVATYARVWSTICADYYLNLIRWTVTRVADRASDLDLVSGSNGYSLPEWSRLRWLYLADTTGGICWNMVRDICIDGCLLFVVATAALFRYAHVLFPTWLRLRGRELSVSKAFDMHNVSALGYGSCFNYWY